MIMTAKSKRIPYPFTYFTAVAPICAPTDAPISMMNAATISTRPFNAYVKYIKGYGIRLLFSVMIVFAGFSVALEQVYKITNHQVFQTYAGVVLIGTAISMSVIIIGKLVADARKERGHR